MGKTPRIMKIGLGVGVALVVLLGALFFWFVHGELTHDINVWLLERRFYAKKIMHPDGSVLLEKKKYLGGKSTHGDPWCVYAVGEIRAVPLSKEDIRKTYQGVTVNFWKELLPLKVLFADEYEGSQTLPYVNWQDELYGMPFSDDTRYVVYVGTQRPILFFDLRCDD